jgi:hypothetical protein
MSVILMDGLCKKIYFFNLIFNFFFHIIAFSPQNSRQLNKIYWIRMKLKDKGSTFFFFNYQFLKAYIKDQYRSEYF